MFVLADLKRPSRSEGESVESRLDPLYFQFMEQFRQVQNFTEENRRSRQRAAAAAREGRLQHGEQPAGGRAHGCSGR